MHLLVGRAHALAELGSVCYGADLASAQLVLSQTRAGFLRSLAAVVIQS